MIPVSKTNKDGVNMYPRGVGTYPEVGVGGGVGWDLDLSFCSIGSSSSYYTKVSLHGRHLDTLVILPASISKLLTLRPILFLN